jgi:hypothetical protein
MYERQYAIAEREEKRLCQRGEEIDLRQCWIPLPILQNDKRKGCEQKEG